MSRSLKGNSSRFDPFWKFSTVFDRVFSEGKDFALVSTFIYIFFCPVSLFPETKFKSEQEIFVVVVVFVRQCLNSASMMMP